MAATVAQQYLHGDSGIMHFLIRQIDQRAGDPIRHLVRVGGVDFFKYTAFLSRRLAADVFF